MNPEHVNVTVRLSTTQSEKLDDIAKSIGWTKASVLRNLVESFLDGNIKIPMSNAQRETLKGQFQ